MRRDRQQVQFHDSSRVLTIMLRLPVCCCPPLQRRGLSARLQKRMPPARLLLPQKVPASEEADYSNSPFAPILRILECPNFPGFSLALGGWPHGSLPARSPRL